MQLFTRILICSGLVGAALALLPRPVLADEILVLKKDLDCLISHADNYLAVEKPVQMVFLSLCPNATPSSDQIQQAQTVNSLPEFQVTKGKVTSILVLSHDQIHCLKQGIDGVVEPTEVANPSEPIVRVDLVKCSHQ